MCSAQARPPGFDIKKWLFIHLFNSSPEDCLCWSSSWNDDRARACHDFPGEMDSFLSYLLFNSLLIFANMNGAVLLNLPPNILS